MPGAGVGPTVGLNRKARTVIPTTVIPNMTCSSMLEQQRRARMRFDAAERVRRAKKGAA